MISTAAPAVATAGFPRWLIWVLVAILATVALDRLLLSAERRGWINYRRRGLSRPGAAYHALTLQSIFQPGAEQLQEVQYTEIEEADESGDPPGDDEPDPIVRDTSDRDTTR